MVSTSSIDSSTCHTSPRAAPQVSCPSICLDQTDHAGPWERRDYGCASARGVGSLVQALRALVETRSEGRASLVGRRGRIPGRHADSGCSSIGIFSIYFMRPPEILCESTTSLQKKQKKRSAARGVGVSCAEDA